MEARPVSEERGFKRMSTFARTWTENIAFPRIVTEAFGLNNDSEEAWAKRLMQEYANLRKGNEGDVPAPAGFARESGFWQAMFWSGIFGVIMGFVVLGFNNVGDEIPKEWVDNKGFDSAEDAEFYKGKHRWILITTCAGLLVGIIRWLYSYPDNLPGIFKEISDYHVDPAHTPLTVILSAISLAGGASLGPEQAMGNCGGGIATLVTEYFEFEEDYKKLVVLCGMSAALGALFPTPLLGVLMIYELGNPPKTYMESIILMSFGACVAFLIYYSVMEYTYLERVGTATKLAELWEFDETQCLTAVVFGFICGALCLTALIFVGVCKQVFNRIKERLNGLLPSLGTVLTPAIGGAIIGTLNWVCPLTVGNGNQVLRPVIQFGGLQLLSTNLLITSAFAKMLTLAISMNCGFVGGFVFPMLAVGTMAGVVAFQQYDYLPLGFCVGCFLAGVPAGICPMPFTLIGIPIYTLYFGLYQTVPIYICTLTSYTVVCGSGLFKMLTERNAGEKKGGEDVKHDDLQKGLIAATALDDSDYTMSNYMANKSKLQREPTFG